MESYLRQIESESIYIIREVASEFSNPCLLYSIGKDSSVLLHLIRKAFYPGKIPFPILHIDTTWKFKEMITFRDRMAKEIDFVLVVYKNEEGLRKGINPLDYDASTYTYVMKTEALKNALDKYKFDAAIGGARRDEEKSRAKERIFSIRSRGYQWDPKNQRPEFCRNYNTLIGNDQTMRVFPLSNWTEINVWEYIKAENIKVVPLYFAKKRLVVERNGQLIMVDDKRFVIKEGEIIEKKVVRFRTLGCYPLTAALESSAKTVDEVIEEIRNSRFSERQGRTIDYDQSSSMEKKKKDGYF